MGDAPAAEDGDVGGPAADVGDDDAALELLLGEHRLGGGERLEDEVLTVETRLVDHLDDVLDRGGGAGDDERLDLEAHPGHPQGVAHPVLPVDGEVAGQEVDDLAVGGHPHRAGRLDGAGDVLEADLTDALGVGADRDQAPARLRGDVAAGEADDDLADLDPGHPLGRVDGLGHRLGGTLDVDHRALAHPPGGSLPRPLDHQALGGDLGHGTADFGSPQVEGGDTARSAHIGRRV